MPCHDPTNYEAEAANAKVQLLTRNLCAIFRAIEARGELEMYLLVAPELRAWWEGHKKTDAKVK